MQKYISSLTTNQKIVGLTIACVIGLVTIPYTTVFVLIAVVCHKLIKKPPLRYGATILFALMAVVAIFPSDPSGNVPTKVISHSKTTSVNQVSSATTTNYADTATNNSEPKSQPSLSGYEVVKVVDGDTIDVSINGQVQRVRLIGINTPETVDPRKPVECFGVEASNKAKSLLSGKRVSLEADSSQGDKDKYQRLLRYVFLTDGQDFGKTMIADGYAYEYTYAAPYKYQKEYKDAQSNAQASQIGLWSPNACKELDTAATPVNTTSTGSKYYTSSASNASKYYPENCSAWQNLSKANLRSFNSLDELLAVYPNRTLAEACK